MEVEKRKPESGKMDPGAYSAPYSGFTVGLPKAQNKKDMEGLESLKYELKQLIRRDLRQLFARLMELINPNSELMNELLLLQAQYTESRSEERKRAIAPAELRQISNQINASVLSLIDDIHEEDLREKIVQKEGVLLYHIPSVMQAHETSRCIARLAIEEAIARQGLPGGMQADTEPVAISEVMQVELISIRPGAFEILAPSQEQFLKKEQYTEWVFYVTPQQTGKQQLLLKVSAIQRVRDKEVKRDIVLEKTVEITAEPAAKEEDTPAFERYKGAIGIQEGGASPSPAAGSPETLRQLVQHLQTGEAGRALLKGLFQAGAIDPTAVAGGNTPLKKLSEQLEQLPQNADEQKLRAGLLEARRHLAGEYLQQKAAALKKRRRRQLLSGMALLALALACFLTGIFGPAAYRPLAFIISFILLIASLIVSFVPGKKQGQLLDEKLSTELKADLLKILRWEQGIGGEGMIE